MKPQTWVGLTLALVFLGTLLQLAGVIAPMWIWLEPDHGNYTIGVGLYYRVGCQSSTGAVCPEVTETFRFGYTDADTYDKYDWPHLTWLETLAGAVALILCVMMVVYAVGFGAWRWLSWMNTAMVFTAIFTWLPIAAGLILFAVERGKVITTSPDLSAVSFPWSALMCFLAGIIFVIVTILIRVKCRVRRFVKNAIPPSADSKMMLNPSTKNHLINRFFTPSPYREDRRQALQSSAYYNDQSALLSSGSVSRAITTNGVENNGRSIEFTNRIHVVEDSPYNYSRVMNREEVSTPLVRTGRIELQEQQQLQQIQERQLQQQQQQRLQQQLQVHEQQQQQQRQQQQNIVTRTTTTTTNQYQTGMERSGYLGQPALARPPPAIENRQEERVFSSEIPLNRQGGHIRVFDTTDDDAETVYYKGREEPRQWSQNINTGLHRADRTDTSRVIQQEVRQTGFTQQPENSTTQEVRDIVIQERQVAPQNRQFFRVGASQAVGLNDSHLSQYTTHMRQVNADAKEERVILNPGQLVGGNYRYNDKFIYRPYSELQMY